MSFSTTTISKRRQVQNQRHSRGRYYMLFLILAGMAFVTYNIWNVGSIELRYGKYNIGKGYSVSTLAEKLGFDVASWRYKAWLKFFGPKIESVPVGTYQVGTGTTINDFLTKTIIKPLYNDLTITLLPGWNMWDIDDYLANRGVGKVGDFLQTAQINFKKYQADFPFLQNVSSLEGFLYPDTYRIREDATADAVIRVMLKEFDKKIGTDYKALDSKRAYQTLILASIVEREERVDANQPIVAGILAKRVTEKIPMGADATVCYGHQKTQKQCTPSFIASVIQVKNPYNTRNMQGYPPTPIASVPLSAWKASLNPESSSYYYYLHDSTGQIHYGKTNEEHIANKKKYLQ